MNKFFTADTHFEFPGLLTKMGRKGFQDMPEHDKIVLDAINTMVSREDKLYILGDFAWQRPEKFRGLIQCKNVVFVNGNHDRPDATKRAFGVVHDLVEAKLADGSRAYCTHYPMTFWDRSHKGSYHFYGHMHAQRETYLDSLFPERRSMDVGIDNARRIKGRPEPFSEHELLELLSGRKGHDDVQFYLDYQAANPETFDQ